MFHDQKTGLIVVVVVAVVHPLPLLSRDAARTTHVLSSANFFLGSCVNPASLIPQPSCMPPVRESHATS